MSFRSILILLWAGALASLMTVAAAPASAVVATLAGSGGWGTVDASAASASFMMPAGVAFDRTGNLFITDAQAQRIRELTTTGQVRTVAGAAVLGTVGLSVPGGYRDGTAANARFNHPNGIAVDRRGKIYIADSWNHCIRTISTNGVVTTYAGSATESDYVNGPRLRARFRQPEGLAIDRSGNLYVADVATGLRKISSSGTVTTINRRTTDNNEAIAVAVFDTESGPELFVAERFGLSILDPDGSIKRFPAVLDYDMVSPRVPRAMLRIVQARRPLGFPTAIAAIDDHTVAFTDARTNTVRVLETVHGTLRVVGGTPNDDASGDTGGFRDGDSSSSLFNAPLGIAVRGDQLVVADSGNRRIRTISGIDYRHAMVPALGLLDFDSGSSRTQYRIAFLGNSIVWDNTSWADSIEGVIESKLNADRVMLPPVRVIGIAGNERVGAAADYAEWLTQIGQVNLVVMTLNTGNLWSSFGDKLPPIASWQPELTRRLLDLRRQLAAHHVALIVVTHPYPFEFDTAESAYTQVTQDLSYRNGALGKATNDAVVAAGAQLIDLWPKFGEYEQMPTHAALFGGDDAHFSRAGREIVGQWVAQALEQLAPWRS
jgi:sugar lactone lactonase YvrE